MQNFGIHFLTCNLIFAGMIFLLTGCKKLLTGRISPQIQYRFWILMLALLFVPFLPVDFPDFPLPWMLLEGAVKRENSVPAAGSGSVGSAIPEDFAVSVPPGMQSEINQTFLWLWAAGMAIMAGYLFFSWRRFRRVCLSALPVENPRVHRIFDDCRRELHVNDKVRLYSTAVLRSPAAAGIFRPAVYLPLPLISDFSEDALRYILLHELRHCCQMDGLMNLFADFVQILYWFNPAVWYGLKKMRLDRELACDSAVLEILEEGEYAGYGHTLLDLAEGMAGSFFPFSSGIGGNTKQIRLRILNIAQYRRESRKKKGFGVLTYIVISALFLSFVPELSIQASGDIYEFDPGEDKVVSADLSGIFQGYEGSFVLYDSAGKTWEIYNPSGAQKRTAPESTYKIYAALHGLEEGVISPEDSYIAWDGSSCPFPEWERDQNLTSAMQNSVNWYFQNIDCKMGIRSVRAFLRKLHYGNETVGNDLKYYWMDQSLKISPIEQVELLRKLHGHQLPFSEENIEAVEKTFCLAKSEAGSLYGKTGTGQEDHVNVNGWFVGYLEMPGNVYYFAANILSGPDASGSRAAEITAEALEELTGFSLSD